MGLYQTTKTSRAFLILLSMAELLWPERVLTCRGGKRGGKKQIYSKCVERLSFTLKKDPKNLEGMNQRGLVLHAEVDPLPREAMADYNKSTQARL